MMTPSQGWERLRAVWRPELFHGVGKRRHFFEGWYYKLVNASRGQMMAIIPGVFHGLEVEASHAFIQVLDGVTGNTCYFRFPMDAFVATSDPFMVRIGDNQFSLNGLSLDLEGDIDLSGEVELGERTPWPVTLLSPGIMGPFAFVPRMQCNHGVLSMDHELNGRLTLNGLVHDFTGGRGYLEKDWGRGFPKAYLWMQCNHFESLGTSLSLSVATIPWASIAFRGFIIGFLHEGEFFRFTTYNRSRIEQLAVKPSQLQVTVRRGDLRLEVEAQRSSGGTLRSPEGAAMQERVMESMGGSLHVSLYRKGTALFEGVGYPAAAEVVGDISR